MEFQISAKAKWNDYDEQTSSPTTKDKLFADSVANNGHVMQGFADGYIAIIGHDGQEKKFFCSKKNDRKS